MSEEKCAYEWRCETHGAARDEGGTCPICKPAPAPAPSEAKCAKCRHAMTEHSGNGCKHYFASIKESCCCRNFQLEPFAERCGLPGTAPAPAPSGVLLKALREIAEGGTTSRDEWPSLYCLEDFSARIAVAALDISL